GKTVGVVGSGQIGQVFAQIMRGFGCQVLAYDPYPNPAIEALGGRFVGLDQLLAESDIISLHCPLNDATRHLVNADSLQRMKRGAML
ncbi:2-hydroxyacid dehydrogenase, partial [Paenibacillus polymyxa]|nr:2-hydroxyacid dehydrogenase [Paenibacillus polymyxa]